MEGHARECSHRSFENQPIDFMIPSSSLTIHTDAFSGWRVVHLLMELVNLGLQLDPRNRMVMIAPIVTMNNGFMDFMDILFILRSFPLF